MKIKTIFLVLVVLFISSCGPITGLFDKGGRKFIIEVQAIEGDPEAVTDLAVNVLSSRLNGLGVRFKVTKMPPARIEVLIYGADRDSEPVRKLILAESRFELSKIAGSTFQTFPTREAALKSLGGQPVPDRRVLPYTEKADGDGKKEQWVVVESPPVIDGNALRDASAYQHPGQDGDQYSISFTLKPQAAQKFGEWTGRNVGSYLGIVLNDEVKSAPVIKTQIFDRGQLEGKFTKEAAEDLALVLRSGYLPATLTMVEETEFK